MLQAYVYANIPLNTLLTNYASPPKIKKALLYVCKGKKATGMPPVEEVRICLLMDDNSLIICLLNGKILFNGFLTDSEIEKIYKNSGEKNRGIICHLRASSCQFIYVPNQFLRDTKLNSIVPYVRHFIIFIY